MSSITNLFGTRLL